MAGAKGKPMPKGKGQKEQPKGPTTDPIWNSIKSWDDAVTDVANTGERFVDWMNDNVMPGFAQETGGKGWD